MLLGACAMAPKPVSTQAPAATAGAAKGETPAVTTGGPSTNSSSASAVEQLLAQAQSMRASGDVSGSLSRLERALRIAPDSAAVYLELARSYSAAGNGARAAASAERGLLFCSAAMCEALQGYLP